MRQRLGLGLLAAMTPASDEVAHTAEVMRPSGPARERHGGLRAGTRYA